MKRYFMGEEDKTLEELSDEDYKVAPTSADGKYMKKNDARAAGENYELPNEKPQE